jgi:predicted ATP-dependent protease
MASQFALFLPAREGKERPSSAEAFLPYRVNVLLDRRDQKGAPVIVESNPTMANLIGQIEKRSVMGTVTTDFTLVQAGSLLKANGGILILDIHSVLSAPFVWEALKRSLKNQEVTIEDTSALLGFGATALKPEPIPLHLKVILLGNPALFHLLQRHDPKFNKIFRIRADFDSETVLNEETTGQFFGYIARLAQEEQWLPFSKEALFTLLEKSPYPHQKKLNLVLGPLMSTLREAQYYAGLMEVDQVEGAHIEQALTAFRNRHNLLEEKVRESLLEETLLVTVTGESIGQINGLAVYQTGTLSFGKPSRITATAAMGRNGVINIERESKLSGKIHDKGVLILAGLLGELFAWNVPLSVNLSVTFEQNYGGVDGDSASAAELFAILSCLGRFPLRQDLAVTGSINQKGEIQAIGGVNEKILGFFHLCQARGLTGTQGVIFPKANLPHLCVADEVMQAIASKQFHLYAISDVWQGLSLLAQQPVGVWQADGNYPEGSLLFKVENELARFAYRSTHLKERLGERFEPKTKN